MYKQIIPISGLWAKFKDKDGEWEEIPVQALGLNEEGHVVPLCRNNKGYFVDAHLLRDFVRLGDEILEPKIIQIIPIKDMWAVFENNKDKEIRKRVEVLGLDELGYIHPFCMEMGTEFAGIFSEPSGEKNFVRFQIDEEKK